MEKLKKLERIIREMGSCLIAFSGGVDSTFLLKVVSQILPKTKLLAVTADSPTYPKEELKESKKISRSLGVRQKIIKTQELKENNFIRNPLNRCYFCKKELFGRLKKMAKRYKLHYVVDATNVSDKKDYRPGTQAKKELGVRSPLLEAGIDKEEIRRYSKKLGLFTWNKPQLACLASRIPYGRRIELPLLKRIASAESFLKKLGFSQVRVRHYNGFCRIEVAKNDLPALITRRQPIVKNLRRLGYHYITLDLEGYRPGSMNIQKEEQR